MAKSSWRELFLLVQDATDCLAQSGISLAVRIPEPRLQPSISASAVSDILLQAQGNCSKTWIRPPLGKRVKFEIASSLIVLKCKCVCVCVYLSFHSCVYTTVPEQFVCYPCLVFFLDNVRSDYCSSSILMWCEGKVHYIKASSPTQKGQREVKNLLTALSFPEDPWMNFPFFSSSSIYSPVQQLPADPGNQENRWRDVPLWGPDLGSWGDQLQRYSGHRKWWVAQS